MSAVPVEGSTAVCVLGMSRSGTSLTARVLGAGGVHLGREGDLLQGDLRQLAGSPAETRAKAAAANPEGFWEHYEIMRLNERLLRLMGGSWRNPPALPDGWEASSELDAERARARELLEESFSGARLWGWKDPRNSLTLPFWRSLVPRMLYVICVRDPLDVAASLARRDRMPPGTAFELWLRYLASALVHTRAGARLLVSYEDYFRDAERVATRLSRFVGLPEKAVAEGARAAVDGRLRHHGADGDRSLEHARLPDAVATLYPMARTLAASTGVDGPDPDGAAARRAVDLHAEWLLAEVSRP